MRAIAGVLLVLPLCLASARTAENLANSGAVIYWVETLRLPIWMMTWARTAVVFADPLAAIGAGALLVSVLPRRAMVGALGVMLVGMICSAVPGSASIGGWLLVSVGEAAVHVAGLAAVVLAARSGAHIRIASFAVYVALTNLLVSGSMPFTRWAPGHLWTLAGGGFCAVLAVTLLVVANRVARSPEEDDVVSGPPNEAQRRAVVWAVFWLPLVAAPARLAVLRAVGATWRALPSGAASSGLGLDAVVAVNAAAVVGSAALLAVLMIGLLTQRVRVNPLMLCLPGLGLVLACSWYASGAASWEAIAAVAVAAGVAEVLFSAVLFGAYGRGVERRLAGAAIATWVVAPVLLAAALGPLEAVLQSAWSVDPATATLGIGLVGAAALGAASIPVGRLWRDAAA